MRDGAARYKDWLVRRYTQNAKSLAAVVPLIQDEGVPEELAFKDVNQNLGADRYRLHLLKIFKTKGSAEMEKQLSRK